MLTPSHDDPNRSDELKRRKKDPESYCICDGKTEVKRPAKDEKKDAAK